MASHLNVNLTFPDISIQEFTCDTSETIEAISGYCVLHYKMIMIANNCHIGTIKGLSSMSLYVQVIFEDSRHLVVL